MSINLRNNLKLYIHELSGHSHRARLFINLLGLDATIVPVDLLSGAHKSPQYLAKNPFGQVPVLEDGEDFLHDSNAILVYLANKYDESKTWYPEDAKTAADVQVWLSKAANELANSVAAARLVTVFNAPFDHDALIEKAHAFLKVMESQINSSQWFVGDKPTIADVALYSYTAHAEEGGVSLRNYPGITAWIKRVEGLPGFIPMQSTDTQAKSAIAALESLQHMHVCKEVQNDHLS